MNYNLTMLIKIIVGLIIQQSLKLILTTNLILYPPKYFTVSSNNHQTSYYMQYDPKGSHCQRMLYRYLSDWNKFGLVVICFTYWHAHGSSPNMYELSLLTHYNILFQYLDPRPVCFNLNLYIYHFLFFYFTNFN